ncbi:MAG: hypothetical protein AB7U82_30460 [Blastocatellales bacterium]
MPARDYGLAAFPTTRLLKTNDSLYGLVSITTSRIGESDFLDHVAARSAPELSGRFAY